MGCQGLPRWAAVAWLSPPCGLKCEVASVFTQLEERASDLGADGGSRFVLAEGEPRAAAGPRDAEEARAKEQGALRDEHF